MHFGLRRRLISRVAEPSAVSPDDETLEYVRRVYATAREWYTVAELKAQLLLVANGTFLTISLGAVFGNVKDLAVIIDGSGSYTLVFFGIALAAVVSAVICAALCLLSLHGGKSRRDLSSLGVDVEDPGTYRPEALWYFGHLARLKPDDAAARLRGADRQFEITALIWNVLELSRRVLRKHRYVNAGWAFTAGALVALAAGVASLISRA